MGKLINVLYQILVQKQFQALMSSSNRCSIILFGGNGSKLMGVNTNKTMTWRDCV